MTIFVHGNLYGAHGLPRRCCARPLFGFMLFSCFVLPQERKSVRLGARIRLPAAELELTHPNSTGGSLVYQRQYDQDVIELHDI